MFDLQNDFHSSLPENISTTIWLPAISCLELNPSTRQICNIQAKNGWCRQNALTLSFITALARRNWISIKALLTD